MQGLPCSSSNFNQFIQLTLYANGWEKIDRRAFKVFQRLDLHGNTPSGP